MCKRIEWFCVKIQKPAGVLQKAITMYINQLYSFFQQFHLGSSLPSIWLILGHTNNNLEQIKLLDKVNVGDRLRVLLLWHIFAKLQLSVFTWNIIFPYHVVEELSREIQLLAASCHVAIV